MFTKSKFIAATVAAITLASQAGAATVTDLVYKLTDSASYSGSTSDANATWNNTGGLNEGVAGAKDLVNNGVDYKSSFVDTSWADVLSVRVAMYLGGVEQAFIEFDAAGTTKTNFFSVGNVIASTWSDITTVGHNYFSIDGHEGSDIDRNWFVNTSYGGCPRDVGHFVVVDRPGSTTSAPCTWEATRMGTGDGTRAFLYTTGTTQQNWNTANVGIADVFAVSVKYDDGTSVVPLPGSGALLLGAFGAAGLLRRKARKQA